MRKIAAVGEESAVFGFRAFGVDVLVVEDPRRAAEVLAEARTGGYAVIIVTEETARAAPEAIEGFAESVLPALVIVPGAREPSGGLASRRMKKIVEKAVGADILFQERG